MDSIKRNLALFVFIMLSTVAIPESKYVPPLEKSVSRKDLLGFGKKLETEVNGKD